MMTNYQIAIDVTLIIIVVISAVNATLKQGDYVRAPITKSSSTAGVVQDSSRKTEDW